MSLEKVWLLQWESRGRHSGCAVKQPFWPLLCIWGRQTGLSPLLLLKFSSLGSLFVNHLSLYVAKSREKNKLPWNSSLSHCHGTGIRIWHLGLTSFLGISEVLTSKPFIHPLCPQIPQAAWAVLAPCLPLTGQKFSPLLLHQGTRRKHWNPSQKGGRAKQIPCFKLQLQRNTEHEAGDGGSHQLHLGINTFLPGTANPWTGFGLHAGKILISAKKKP